MEELDLLKKDWKKSENSFEQLSEKDIYKMIHQKSSSVVKWILIISLIELSIGILLNVLSLESDFFNKIDAKGYTIYIEVLTIVNYAVILFFVYKFFKNYKTISSTDSTKKLMDDIISTRKTVQYYIWYNLIMIAISAFLGSYVALSITEETKDIALDSSFRFIFYLTCILVVGILVFLFWLFYILLYGRLLNKLFNNYNELKKIDL
jgi:hypothetical protein